jgi:hypothetical protein
MPASPNASKRARAQATAYDSVFASTSLELTYEDGETETIEIPPHPNLQMLDDEQQAAYEELLFEVEGYDREDDVYIPEQHLESGAVLPEQTRKGAIKQPYRKDGVLIKPPHNVRAVQIALGDEKWKKLQRAGKQASDIWRIWNRQGLEIAERQDGDSFRDAGAS